VKQLEISAELRRAGVAAETIRSALRPWIESERDRIIAALASSPSELSSLLKIQVDAAALFHLKRQLETAMGQAHVPVEKI
jgi:hypothetical protein